MKITIIKSTGIVILELDNLKPLLEQSFSKDEVDLIVGLLEYHFTEAVE
jgi:hypothetical protein